MLLILGDCYAERARQACRLGTGTEARGWRGARINNDDFRRWAVEVTHRLRPRDVLLIIGGNDVAAPQFSPRVFGELFQELILGLYAAGAHFVHVLPIPPRATTRPGSVSVAVYRRRRRLANQVLRRMASKQEGTQTARFALRTLVPSERFLGRDGVHPSEAGWRDMMRVVRDITSV